MQYCFGAVGKICAAALLAGSLDPHLAFHVYLLDWQIPRRF